MKYYDALVKALGQVDETDWRDKLEALHDERGTWQKTADALGIHKRTLERWRKGYQPRRGGPRRYISPGSIVPTLREAWGKDRRAQVAAVDWKKQVIVGTIEIGGGEYIRHETMYVGRYFTADSVQGIVTAYVAADARLTQQAVDFAMSWDYIGDGATRLLDVDELRFS